MLVTIDVTSLYTSIPNYEGPAAVKKRHDIFTSKKILTKKKKSIFGTYSYSE